MLATWRNSYGREATLDRLNDALTELGWISLLTQIRNTPDNFYVVHWTVLKVHMNRAWVLSCLSSKQVGLLSHISEMLTSILRLKEPIPGMFILINVNEYLIMVVPNMVLKFTNVHIFENCVKCTLSSAHSWRMVSVLTEWCTQRTYALHQTASPDRSEHQATWRNSYGREATLDRLNDALTELGWISLLTQIRNTPDNFYVVHWT